MNLHLRFQKGFVCTLTFTAISLLVPSSFSAPCVQPPAGLVSWWRAEENAFDSRDSNNGDVSGGLSYVGGVAGSAFCFDGSTGAVTLTSPTNLAALQDFTIETWLRRRSTTLATFNSPADGHGHFWGFGIYGYSAFIDPVGHVGLSKTGYEFVANTNRITDTNWHHVAITKGGNQVVIYVDGIGYQTPSYNVVFTNTGTAMIGGIPFDSGYHLYGEVDEFSIYNRPLTSNEVVSVYAAGTAGKCFQNASPIAGNTFGATVQNRALEILKEKILAYCSDPDGDVLSVTSISAISTNGGAISNGTSSVTFTPASNFIGVDAFSFTVSDGQSSASGTIQVQVGPSNAPSSNMLPPQSIQGGLKISFAGVAGRTYTLQRAPTLSGPWQSIAAILVAPNGIGIFNDTNAPPENAFYRTIYP
jgi:hypothetical protein